MKNSTVGNEVNIRRFRMVLILVDISIILIMALGKAVAGNGESGMHYINDNTNNPVESLEAKAAGLYEVRP